MTRFYIDLPAFSGRTKEGFSIYVSREGWDLKWSAAFPLPEVGDHIWILLNNIGWAYVEGYFESDGFLGVMTRATNPPAWLRAQRRRDNRNNPNLTAWQKKGIGCEFGAEIALKRPKVKKA